MHIQASEKTSHVRFTVCVWIKEKDRFVCRARNITIIIITFARPGKTLITMDYEQILKLLSIYRMYCLNFQPLKKEWFYRFICDSSFNLRFCNAYGLKLIGHESSGGFNNSSNFRISLEHITDLDRQEMVYHLKNWSSWRSIFDNCLKNIPYRNEIRNTSVKKVISSCLVKYSFISGINTRAFLFDETYEINPSTCT